MEHRLTTGIQGRESARPFPGAGGDELSLRIDAEDGDCPTLERLIEIAGRHGVRPAGA